MNCGNFAFFPGTENWFLPKPHRIHYSGEWTPEKEKKFMKVLFDLGLSDKIPIIKIKCKTRKPKKYTKPFEHKISKNLSIDKRV